MPNNSFSYPFSAFVLASALVALPSGALAAPQLDPSANKYVPGEVLVKLKPDASIPAGKAAVASKGGIVHAALQKGMLHVKLPGNQTVVAAVSAYAGDPSIEYAQPNYVYRIAAAPSDPQYGQSWAYKNSGQTISGGTYTPNFGASGNDMNIEPAWGHITDCSSVVVAVIDSGVNYNQEDLTNNMWVGAAYPNHGINFTGEGLPGDPMDLHGHGTHVAGIIGAVGNNGLGTTGVCWKASIMAVRVMDSSGSGTTASIIQGVDFAVANGAKVINMSLGGSAAFDQAFSDAITSARNSDVVVVVASGNEARDNETTKIYPCNFTHANLICVTALDQNYALAKFSNWGAASVDVGAPGTNILNAWAGTPTTITDPLDAAAPWTSNSTGWGYGRWTPDFISYYNMLTSPANWGLGNYGPGTDDHVYKNFNLAGYDAATLNFYLAGVVNSGDALAVAMSPGGGDPFPTTAPLVAGSLNSPNQFFHVGLNVSPCMTATCTIGFALQSAAASTGAMGPAITLLSIDALTLNANTFRAESGTSMASPGVAGLATMLRAYNPGYTYADVVDSIKNAGRAKASLAGKTTTGKAVDVAASLAYIAKPAGLAAAVQ